MIREVAAAAAAGSVLVLVTPPRRLALWQRIEPFLQPTDPPVADPVEEPLALRRAGLNWTPQELTIRRGAAAIGGAVVGLLLAQGNLFLAGAQRSAPGLATAGALCGLLGLSIFITSRRERRARALHHELPVIADSLALGVLAGESVAEAISRFTSRASGVGAQELRWVLTSHAQGEGLGEVLLAAARRTAHPEAARLYELLASAHHTGGRLADGMAELATDFRAGLARELTNEGGRRALAIYGPILALMIPVSLMFLIYPALTALQSLAGTD